MRITVDLNLCQDHGQCAIAAPKVFRMNDDGKLEYVSEADDSYRAEVEVAAYVCPVQAIAIED